MHRLEDMRGGWFMGAFNPTALCTGAAEVAIKCYKAGDQEAWHVHRIATEVTVIVSGSVTMNGTQLVSGDIVVIEPGEGTDFQVLEDTVTVVAKVPSTPGDKYLKTGEKSC
jgi:quercetin dioxygenase-like cupin family protein